MDGGGRKGRRDRGQGQEGARIKTMYLHKLDVSEICPDKKDIKPGSSALRLS